MTLSNSPDLAGVLRTSPAFLLLLALGGGCGPEVEVLTDDTGGAAGLDGSGASAGSGGHGGTGEKAAGGAGNSGAGAASGAAGAAPLEGNSVCGAIVPGDIMSLKTGEPCPDRDICEPSACAGTFADGRTGVFAACRNHRIELITLELLGDVSGSTPLDNGVSWDDCDAALAGGVSGETCTWVGKSCVRLTEDTCCREGVDCVPSPGDAPDYQIGQLRRIRVCAPDCENLEPDTTMPVVTDCASALAADRCHVTPACEGDFTCYGTAGDWSVTEYGDTGQLNGAMWCAGGSLVGGYGLTWGP